MSIAPPHKKLRTEVCHDSIDRPATEADVVFVTQGFMPPSSSTMRREVKLTPLEQQVVTFKRQVAPHVLLFVACGYRMRLLGRDSRVAARRLGIMCVPNKPFENSSVPTGRVMFHAMRLIGMGYVVGIVEQVESRAIRQEEGVDSGVFDRKIGRLMSRGTMIGSSDSIVTKSSEQDGDDVRDGGADEVDASGQSANATSENTISNLLDEASDKFMLFLCEGQTSLGVTAVSFVRGAAVYSAVVASDPLRTGVVDIIAALNPVEIIAEEGLSAESEARLHASLGLNRGPSDEGIEDAYRTLFVVVPREQQPASSPTTELDVRSYAMALEYLRPFGLSEIFAGFEQRNLREVVRGTSAAASSVMMLPGRTIANLDVLRCIAPDVGRGPPSVTNEGMRGSLMWHLNHCSTPFGFRKLRGWLLYPLCDLQAVEARRNVVRALAAEDGALRGKIGQFFRPSLRDLAAVLQRLSMGRCSPSDYIAMLSSVSRVAVTAQKIEWNWNIDAPCGRLREMISTIASSELAAEVTTQLAAINVDAVEPWHLFVTADFTTVSPSAPESIRSLLSQRGKTLEELHEELNSARRVMKHPSLEYKTVLATPYLLEVPLGKEKLAPKTWTVVSRTKACARFRTPEIEQLAIRLSANSERIRLAGLETWEARQKNQWSAQTNCQCRTRVRDFVDVLGDLDALMSLAVVAQIPGYTCPKLHDPESRQRRIVLRGVRHPMQAAMITNSKGDAYVPNDVEIGSGDSGGTWILTGPNMGGKSALMRSVALVCLMAQVGSYVPCDYAELPLFTSIRTRMGSTDSLTASTFLVEMRETAAILNAQDLSTSLLLLDELGRGTSSYDGVAVADATLNFLARSKATVFFVTHYPMLCAPFRARNLTGPVDQQLQQKKKMSDGADDALAADQRLIVCKYMAFARRSRARKDVTSNVVNGTLTSNAEYRGSASESEPNCSADDDDDDIVLLYQAVDGVTPSSFGLSIARTAHIPSHVVSLAKQQSAHCEAQSTAIENLYLVRGFLGQPSSV